MPRPERLELLDGLLDSVRLYFVDELGDLPVGPAGIVIFVGARFARRGGSD